MKCTLLISNLPTDASSHALEILLARGETTVRKADVRNANEDTYDALRCKLFGVGKSPDWPTAPLHAMHDGLVTGDAYWLHATPVWLLLDRSQLVMGGVPDALTLEESRALIAALNAHFAQDGLTFHAPHPQRWYVNIGAAPRSKTTALEQVIGRNIANHFPQGDDALRWVRVLNEAQMILHEHPVNTAREARGAVPVNSIWLWGGGHFPTAEASHYFVATDDVLAGTLAQAAKTLHIPLPIDAGIWLSRTHSPSTLITLEPALDDTSLLKHWCSVLLAALRVKHIATLDIIAHNDNVVIETRITAKQVRRWWRRTKPLSAYQA